jgi:alcohol dehydrogenase (cytochrome c)
MATRSREKRYIAGAVAAAAMLILLVAVAIAVTQTGSSSKSTGSTAASTAATTTGAAKPASVGANGIALAPAFSASDLNAVPGADWITNGGSLANDRYSSLDEINDGNVQQLKGVWMTSLNRSGVAQKYSAEGQPIVYQGTIYQSTGADDVFAVDVKTGKIKWQYQAKLDQQIDTVCCGWLSRGVAIGDGKVYIGQLDGKMVALDQATGKVAWTSPVTDWRTGSGITAAPLYYEGRIYTGVTGGEFGVRGRLEALDAKTGKEVWRFNTIPGPGEIGHDTWPQSGDAWKHGGAPVWQTPSVDPKLGMIYFTTGNASPDVNGSKRAGDNLFTSSFVALDAETGKYRWHFQQVHHDIWDFDAPSPTVLFDAKVSGKTVPAIAEASKTGFLYMLDRQTGKPLYGIPEKPVEQNAYQHTAKTQPFPTNPPFASQTVRDDAYAVIKKQIADVNKKLAKPLSVRRGPIFSPQGHDSVVVTAPDASGGTNWQPSSYNPKTNMIYVCSQDGVAGYSASDIPGFKEGEQYIGSVIAITGFGPNPGHLTAIDAGSGAITWHQDFKESCYSGSATTAGNLTFVGRNDGELEAYNATTGQHLWSFQTGAGANNVPTVFEQDGHEYVAFYAGGNSLAGTSHGDSLWLFSLDGTMGPAKPGAAAEAAAHAGETPVTTTPTPAPTGTTGAGAAAAASAGQQVFADNCSVCHGATGTGGNGGPDLTSLPDAADQAKVEQQVRNGGGGMPAFKGTLNDQDIENVAAYVTQNIAKK